MLQFPRVPPWRDLVVRLFMNAHDKADEDAAFRIQARRAGRAVMWALRVVAVMFLGLVLCVAGVVFTQSLSPWPWVGVPVGLSGIAVFCYGLWWGMIGRFRCLTCPRMRCAWPHFQRRVGIYVSFSEMRTEGGYWYRSASEWGVYSVITKQPNKSLQPLEQYGRLRKEHGSVV